jgi:hypothetical protein
MRRRCADSAMPPRRRPRPVSTVSTGTRVRSVELISPPITTRASDCEMNPRRR